MYTKKLIQLLLTVLILLFLSACTSIPTKLGIAETEWSGYSKEKQQLLLSNYNRLLEKHDRESENKKNNDLSLEISIHDGQVMMPPFINWQSYKPVNFAIFKEQCRDIVLQAIDESSQIELGVCFKSDVLYLDPSHYDLKKKDGSISISSSPLWLSGFAYKKISSSGYARLNNVTIEVLQKDQVN